VETSDEMMLPNRSRRRTPGGVFFYLLGTDVGQKEWCWIFRLQTTGHGAQGADQTMATEATPFDWATFGTAATEAMSNAGEATTVKLTVIGKPGTVVERGDVVLVAMRSEKAPSFPKGVPAPASPQTDYMVPAGRKQWGKVAEVLAGDPAAKVIVEGYPTVRLNFSGITVHATSATTGIQTAKRTAAPPTL